jgi:hypothetical protein
MTTKARFVLLISFFAMIAGVRAASAADPTTAECLTATEASLKLRNDQKLRDARSELLICSASSCPADVRTECVRRMAELNAAIPGIVFDAKDAAGNDLMAVTVTMDGHLLTERLQGAAISIDPGPHKFAFATAGQPRVEKQFVIREGEKSRRERIIFGAATASASPVASVTPPTPVAASLAPAPPALSTEDGGGARKEIGPAPSSSWAYGTAAGAGVSVVFAVVETVIWKNKETEFSNHAGPPAVLPSSMMSVGCGKSDPGRGAVGCSDIYDAGMRAWALSLVGYGMGTALAAASIYLFVAERKNALSSDTRLSWACVPDVGMQGASCDWRF